MAFLDFLKRKNGHAKPPADQRADIDAALAKIAVDRTSAQLVLGGLDRRREDLLLTDAPASEIVKLDEEGDHARIKLEKLDVFEAELHARLSEIEGAEAEVEVRRDYDRWHAVACDYAASFNETYRLRSPVLSAMNALAANETARKYGLVPELPPLILSGEALQKFIRDDIERIGDLESRRRAAVERRTQEVQG